MTAQLGRVRLIVQVVPAAVAHYWPVLGLASNLATAGRALPGCRYVELNAGRLLLTVLA